MSFPRTRRSAAALALLGALLAVLGLVRPAAAHPLGNFSVNHYNRIELAPAGARILYVLDLAEIPAFQLKQRVDADGDSRVSAAEQAAYAQMRMEELAAGLTLTVNGAAVPLSTHSPEARFQPGEGGLDTYRLHFWLDAALPPLGQAPAAIEFRNANDAGRLGWREIVLRAADGVSLSGADVSTTDVSRELTEFPQDLLNAPLAQTSASFSASAQAGAVQSAAATPQSAPVFGSTARDSQFTALINYRDLTPSVILLSLMTALGLGALHALEPGHGKSVAAAYLVGTRATPIHAALLGATVTITHTFSVFLMGLVTLFASAFIVPERLFPYLGLLSAFIVMAMGASMIVNALRQRRAAPAGDHAHQFDPDTNELKHNHGGRVHTHVPAAKLNARSVLAVGVSGGLVPCPAALIVLLSAIALGRVGFGMLLIVVFSLGLALVLTLISLLVLASKRALGRMPVASWFMAAMPTGGRFARMLPVFSGVLVIGAGLLLLYYALPFLPLA